MAKDRDKANTANSDIYYWISRGNENLKLSLSPLPNDGAAVVLEKPLDFESGDRELNLTITASVRFHRQRDFKLSMNACKRIL